MTDRHHCVVVLLVSLLFTADASAASAAADAAPGREATKPATAPRSASAAVAGTERAIAAAAAIEEKFELNGQAVTLVIQRIKGVSQNPGYTFYFPDSGNQVTGSTAEFLTFEIRQNGEVVSPEGMSVALQDASGKTLEGLPGMQNSQRLLVIVPLAQTKKRLTASVTLQGQPVRQIAVDVQRLVRQARYFADP